MTGKDMILYILENNLLDEPLFKDGKIPGLITPMEAAVKFGVGTATINVWVACGLLDSVKIGDVIYISANSSPHIEKGVINV